MSGLADEIRMLRTQAAIARRMTEPVHTFAPLPSGGQRSFVTSLVDGGYTSGVYGLVGGNRSGKSETGGWCFANYALNLRRIRPDCVRDDGPAPLWCIAKTYEDSGEIQWKEKLRKYIHPREIAHISWRRQAQGWPSYIKLKSGVEILFKSSDQGRQAFQGKAISGAWFDEQFPADIFEETQMRCVDLGAPLWFSLTPIDPDSYLEERYAEPPAGWVWHTIDIEDNRRSRGGHLPDEEVDRILDELRATDLYETRKSGAFAGFQGAVYKQFSRSTHVMDFGPHDVRHLERRAIGLDFGTTNPLCALWGAMDDQGRWWIYDEHYAAKESIERHIEVIQQKCGEHVTEWEDSHPTELWRRIRVWADPGGDMQATGPQGFKVSGRRRMREVGFTVVNARKDRWRGIECVQRLLAMRADPSMDGGVSPGLIISRTHCPNLIREMASYRYKRATTAGRDAPDDIEKTGDHAPDALRYLIFSESLEDGFTADPRETKVSTPEARQERPSIIHGGRAAASGLLPAGRGNPFMR